jgi:translation initiation factor IF-2
MSGGPRAATVVKPSGPVTIPPQIVVKDLAELLNVSVNEVIRQLIAVGVFAAINQVVKYEAAAKVAEAIGYTPEEAAVQTAAPTATVRAEARKILVRPVDEAGRVVRPPVVTVMGHVDHGKTSLLDAIRNAKVAAGEAGGITQHIGAYQVEINDRKITFLDTPGHEAFTALRARGAQVTDIAVIVVAADDGVMPQTIEAIDHARAAQVPLVVALNKIDKPNANPDFVKQQLADHGVVIEEYGGDVVCVPVSAKKNIGISDLLEMILLVADLQDLRANPRGQTQGVIIEARVDPASGVTSTALVQEGTLDIGDILVVGTVSGKVRAMLDDTGKRIKRATPAMPVSILGLPEVPTAGDRFQVVPDEKAARALVDKHATAARMAQQAVTLDTLSTQMREGTVKELNLIIKCDVQGSAEALRHALTRVDEEHAAENLRVHLIHDAVGNVGEADVHLASASKAIIIAFNVKVDPAAQRLASNQGVDIRSYAIIYKLVDDIEAALKGMLEPVYREQIDGHAEVMQLFKSGKTIIAGCRVTDGKLTRSAQARVLRNSKVVYTGLIQSLRRGKEDAREVAQGFECGIVLEDYNEVEPGDVIETFSKVRV